MSINLTEKEAYAAMYEYLVSVYERTQSDDLGSLLGSMSTIGNSETADPAIWYEWLECVNKVKQNKVDTSLKIET